MPDAAADSYVGRLKNPTTEKADYYIYIQGVPKKRSQQCFQHKNINRRLLEKFMHLKVTITTVCMLSYDHRSGTLGGLVV